MSIFYVASPYSHPDPAVQEDRYSEAMRFVAWHLASQGPLPAPFSPIVYCHEMAKRFDLPKDFLFWRTLNRANLLVSAHMVVLRIPGWDESKGVLDELQFAQMHRIPHYYADPVDDGYTVKLL